MNHFDSVAHDWDANPSHTERTGVIAKAMRRTLPLSRSMRALEFGCGTGLLSLALHEDLGPITMTDTSEGMLEVLKAKIAAKGITNMTPLHLDLTKESLSPGSFDLVFSQLVIHHIDDVDGILKAFHALLAPSGWLCIADLAKEDGSFHGEHFSGHHGFEPAELARQVERAGFEPPSTETVYQLERGGHGKLFPVFLMTARKA